MFWELWIIANSPDLAGFARFQGRVARPLSSAFLPRAPHNEISTMCPI
jgi:hypothetical protein